MKPDEEYAKIAKKISDLMLKNIIKTIEPGKSPDLYFNLEVAIKDALRYVELKTERKVRAEVSQMIEQFDNEDGTTQN